MKKPLFSSLRLSLLALLASSAVSLQAEVVVDATTDFTALSSFPYWKSSTLSPTFSEENGLEIVNEAATSNYWDLQFQAASSVTFDSNAIYTFTTEIKGTDAGTIHAVIGSWGSNISTTFSFSSEWQTVSFRLSSIPAVTGGHVLLQVGDYVGTLQIRNFTITHNTITEGELTVGNVIDKTIDYTTAESYTSFSSVVETASIGLNDGYLEVTNESAVSDYQNQYTVLSGLPLVEGNDYKLTLEIQGSADGTILVAIGSWDNSSRVSVKIPITASETPQTITVRYINVLYGEGAFVLFQTGSYVGTLKIKSVTVSHDEEPTAYAAAISDLGVASLCLPVNTKIPEDVTVYTAAYDAAASVLKLTEIKGVIPANTGVIIEGAEGDYSFDITDEESDAVSDLLGNATDEAVTLTIGDGEAICVLDQVNEKLGFYNLKSGVIPAHKAYLKVSTANGAPAIRIVYGDEPGNVTAIESINLESATSAPIFNLAGQRISSARLTPGIYLRGGKKFLVK
jgi:hypothetical protein